MTNKPSFFQPTYTQLLTPLLYDFKIPVRKKNTIKKELLKSFQSKNKLFSKKMNELCRVFFHL